MGYRGGISADVLYTRLSRSAPGLGGAEAEARAQINLGLVDTLEALTEQINVLEADIGELFLRHPDQMVFVNLPRSGMVRAATLLTEIGDCRERFPIDDAFAALAGASPSTRQSGKRAQTVFRWSCNKKLRAAVMDFANGSRMSDPWAMEVYQRACLGGHRRPPSSTQWVWTGSADERPAEHGRQTGRCRTTHR